MNELIAAAKAVIDAAESYKKDFAPFADEIRTLRAAVERAESSQPVRLSDEEIYTIIKNVGHGSYTQREGTTGYRISRAVEQAVLEKNL